jgi:peroxiredoxin
MMNLLKSGAHPGCMGMLILIALTISTAAKGGWLEAVAPIRPAPSLILEDIEGANHDLRDLEGKVVLVSFWTTWCPPCLEEMPSLIRLNEAMDQLDFVILTVNVQEDERRVRNFASRLKLPFAVLLDTKREAGNAWGIKVFPSSFVVDAKGRLRYRAIGPVEWDGDDVTSTILQLLKE